jgi:endonuclease YncB( thermonuclease family)
MFSAMSRSVFSGLLPGVAVGILVVWLCGPVPVRGQSFAGTVHDVLDGGTVHLLRETGQIVRIELYGVDAPERGQPYGPVAAQALRRMVYDKRIRAGAEGHDEDGRPLFVLRADGTRVNAQLVRRGLAWWDRRRAAAEDRLRRLERRARAAERGLWAQPNPMPPWQWRAQKESGQKKN